jgi:hypothetical protein
VRVFAVWIEFLGLIPIDRLHHADPGKQQRAAVFRAASAVRKLVD